MNELPQAIAQETLLTATSFSEFFRGNESIFGQSVRGTWQLDEEGKEVLDEKGKPLFVKSPDGKQWKASTFKGQVTITEYVKHLSGSVMLGIAPIHSQTKVSFCAIDMDSVAGQEHIMRQQNLQKLSKLEIPLVFARSRSGALHAYLFFDKPQDAKSARDLMREIILISGVESREHESGSPLDVEIFPKQNAETSGRGGNWINLPYFGDGVTNNVVLNEEGKELLINEAIVYIQSRLTNIKTVQVMLKSLPLSDGPPCLQHIVVTGNLSEGQGRNNFVYSLTRYFKAKEETNIEGAVISVNEGLREPLPIGELRPTVRSALQSDSAYLCQQEPLKSLCRRNDCLLRQYGIDSGNISNLSFGQMTKYMDDPPYYDWIINERVIRFNSIDDLWSYPNFQKKMSEKFNIISKNLTVRAWQKILQNAFDNIIEKVLSKHERISNTEQLYARIAEYVYTRGQRDDRMLILSGVPYKDFENNRYLFDPRYLYQFLEDKRFNSLSLPAIREKLENLGARPVVIGGNHMVSKIHCWEITFSALSDYVRLELSDVDYEMMAKETAAQNERGMGV